MSADTSRAACYQPSAIRHQPNGYAGVAALAAAPLRAQQPMTLQQAIELAQKQGLQARAVLDTRDAARWRDRAFNARLMPQLSLAGTLPNYERAIIPVTQPDGSTQFLPRRKRRPDLGMVLSQSCCRSRAGRSSLRPASNAWTSAATRRRGSTARRP